MPQPKEPEAKAKVASSKKKFPKTTSLHTLVPFPTPKKVPFFGKKVKILLLENSPKFDLKVYGSLNQNLKKLIYYKIEWQRLSKSCIEALSDPPKSFSQSKVETERAIKEMFYFLEAYGLPGKQDLIEKFNKQIQTGEIKTATQMKVFLEKSQKLAECIYLYIKKNEYTKNFMQEISYEEFEQGFSKGIEQ